MTTVMFFFITKIQLKDIVETKHVQLNAKNAQLEENYQYHVSLHSILTQIYVNFYSLVYMRLFIL